MCVCRRRQRTRSGLCHAASMVPRPCYIRVTVTLDDCRRFYAEEVRLVANVSSLALVEAFARVPREAFFGPGPWQIASGEQNLAPLGTQSGSFYLTAGDPRDLYHNVLIAIDPTRYLNNGQPTALARWIDALDLKAGDRVFHLGCGVGYYTAIMAEVVGASGSVAAIEVDSNLAVRAKENLANYLNVTVHSGDGAALDPGTCDAIFVNAGVTHPHRPWLERLADNGRLVLPITATIGAAQFGGGIVVKIVRSRGAFSVKLAGHVMIYSCTSVRDPQLEPLVLKALGTKSLFKLKSVRLNVHEPSETCVLHGDDVCLSSADPIEDRDLPNSA
jgi:protein-L-isoaspartate(D-aspartate) O-methyltransferase